LSLIPPILSLILVAITVMLIIPSCVAEYKYNDNEASI
jgi:hypothetical protein